MRTIGTPKWLLLLCIQATLGRGGGANSLTWFVSTFKSIPLELHNTLSVLASFKKQQGAWKILCGNLKILGFLPQIFIKAMFRITKKRQGAGGK